MDRDKEANLSANTSKNLALVSMRILASARSTSHLLSFVSKRYQLIVLWHNIKISCPVVRNRGAPPHVGVNKFLLGCEPCTHSATWKALGESVPAIYIFKVRGAWNRAITWVRRGSERLRTTDLVCVKIFHKAKLQAFVKMQMTRNQLKTQKEEFFENWTPLRYQNCHQSSTTDTRLDLFMAC